MKRFDRPDSKWREVVTLSQISVRSLRISSKMPGAIPRKCNRVLHQCAKIPANSVYFSNSVNRELCLLIDGQLDADKSFFTMGSYHVSYISAYMFLRRKI